MPSSTGRTEAAIGRVLSAQRLQKRQPSGAPQIHANDDGADPRHAGLKVVRCDLGADPDPAFGHNVTNKTGMAVTVVMRFSRTEIAR